MGILSNIFTWWNGSTMGTQWFTRRNGERVGEDTFGNVYYRNADDSRRWVIYKDLAEASAVTPEWHGWLHHTFELYAPPGSLLHPSPAGAPKTKSYTAWTPE